MLRTKRFSAVYPPTARKQIAEEFRLVLGVLMELDPKMLVGRMANGAPAKVY